MSFSSQLYVGEKVYNERNYAELLGNGTVVYACGEPRLLSRMPPPLGASSEGFAIPFEQSGIQVIPRSEWSDRIKEQIAKESRISDLQDFPAFDQDGLPTCWANGPAQAYTTLERIMGLPYDPISACSLAVPISGGHSGGYEGDALQYLIKYGGVVQSLWPNNDTDRSKVHDQACLDCRTKHKALMSIDLGHDFEKYATAALLNIPFAFAYNWMSHVMSGGDLVEIEPGHFGLRQRNSWSDKYGSKNKHGYGGYNVWAEGHGTPDSGFGLQSITSTYKIGA